MNEDKPIEQKESIKLMKMSKGYQWEIRLLDDDIERQMIRLERINKELEKKYGKNE